MKANIVENILKEWYDKYGEDNNRFNNVALNDIAINCASLTEAWFSRVNPEKVSFELNFYDKNADLESSLHGVTADNLPSTLFETLVSKSDQYSKVSLCSYSFDKGKKLTNVIGELDIS